MTIQANTKDETSGSSETAFEVSRAYTQRTRRLFLAISAVKHFNRGGPRRLRQERGEDYEHQRPN